jgi:phosphotransferase system HPr (HPr) family protein
VIGIVVVSHSAALARAAVDLALEMVPGERPAIAIAAGAGEGVTGTDAVRVAEAIDEVASPDGVLVIMDLGSAVLSAEMSLEFRSSDVEVRLSGAPFVEGLLAAIVTAAGGASLATVDQEATSALLAKSGSLGLEAQDAPSVQDAASSPGDGTSAVVTLVNPDGLHARPAATLASTMAGVDAKVTIGRPGGPTVAANSLVGLMSLGAKQGETLTVSASGSQADEIVATLTRLFADGFGELGEQQ